MIKFKWLVLIPIVLFTGEIMAASKSDLAKEKRWREHVESGLIDTTAVTLKAANTEFLALELEYTSNLNRGGVILIHGIGVHPAWPQVIEPLRTDLTQHGWHTLSLQMPVLANGIDSDQYAPLFDEVPARIQAGVDYLKSKNINNIVIVAHSLGTTMTAYYLAQQKDKTIKAFVAVAMSPGDKTNEKMNTLKNLSKINIPILDLFGSEDFAFIVNSAAERKQIAKKAGNEFYTQVKIEDANHFFSNMNDVLLKQINNWLNNHAVRKK